MRDVGGTAPPSGLPALSPARREIGSLGAPLTPGTMMIGEISPLAGQMAGRAEGGGKDRVRTTFSFAHSIGRRALSFASSRRQHPRYLMDSSLATAAVKPASDTGMVTGLRVTDSMPMFRLVPDFMALMRSADSGVAA